VGELTAYRRALDYLFARTTGKTKFGLERTEALLDALGRPERRMPVLHIAGTNGKGSVCATLDALLRAKGLRVGRYTSPHLVDFRERFLVDGRPARSGEIVDFVERWTPEVERLGATFFEATTAMAFELFARAEVDVAVIETGLGGRLDSTNVVHPLVAAVTSIGIDHIEYLGDTREAIAAEKAGIFKRGVPAVIGESEPAIRDLLAAMARERGASAVRIASVECRPRDISVAHDGTRFTLTLGDESRELHTPLTGTHQASNAAVALLALDAGGAPYATALGDAARALEAVRLPGRFQEVGKYVFDVAHNPDGAAVLARTLGAVGAERPVVALLTVLSDKDWRGMMEALAPRVDAFVLTCAPTAPASRAWDPRDAGRLAEERGWRAAVVPDFDEALALADREGATVLVTGSFHTVGDAMARLQVDPLAG
jgi:dihydrofolate synthase/folylpolyglutamate synthase